MSGKMTGMSKVVAIAPQSQWPPPYDSHQWKWPPFPSPCADLCRRCEREKTPCCPTAAQRAKSRHPKPWNPCHLLILQIHDHTWQRHISARDHQTSLTKRMELVLRCVVMMCWTLPCKTILKTLTKAVSQLFVCSCSVVYWLYIYIVSQTKLLQWLPRQI